MRKERGMNAEGSSTYYADVLRQFCRHKLAVCGILTILVIILAVAFVPMALNLDPYSTSCGRTFAKPDGTFVLGLDNLGRDNLARLLYGGRTSIIVGLISTLISMLIGVPLGLIAGYFRGWVEVVIMRMVDVFMSFPSMILILVLVSVFGPSIWSVTMVIGVMGWTQFARIVYGNVLSICSREYVEGAVAVGASHARILRDYIFPNATSSVLVIATYRTASAILQEAALSYLGMGVQPPNASLGNILNAAQSITTLSTRAWFWVPPGILLILIVLSINFIGDGFRDALDPKMKI